MQEQPKNLDKLAKHFRHSISLLKNGVSTCYGLTGKAALAKYNAGSAALVNSLDRELELAVRAGITLEQAFDLYEAELRQNRYAHHGVDLRHIIYHKTSQFAWVACKQG